MSEAGGCPEIIQDLFGWRCGKPIKRNGMCGIHASAKERREANDAYRRATTARVRLSAHGVAFQSSFTALGVADLLDAAEDAS